MARILAFDTSCEACSVAVLNGDEVLDVHQQVPRQHTKKLLPMIEQLLSDAGVKLSDLDAIAFGAGPGSFTGLRITTGVAQGLALGADVPLLPISTLATLAEQARQQLVNDQPNTGILATLDARMGEVYWGAFVVANQQVKAVAPEIVCKPENLPVDYLAQAQSWVGIGPGWNYQTAFPAAIAQAVHHVEVHADPQAGAMVRLANNLWLAGERGVPPEQALPVYLRDEITWQKSNHRNN